jgi:hypothetical protein
MTARVTRTTGRRFGAAMLLAAVLAGSGLVGAGSASAAPRELTCTLDLGQPTDPVTVGPNEQVQLVLVVPLLGTRVQVGPVQDVGSQPGPRVLETAVGTVLGVVINDVCQVAVVVEQVASAAPLPPVSVPTLPVPSEEVTVPLPGAQVSVNTGRPAPVPGSPPPAQQPVAQPPAAGEVEWRFGQSRFPLHDYSLVPYGVGYRYGSQAAPAFRYGQRLSGYSPQFGVLPEEDLGKVGSVAVLPIGGGRIAPPVLLAVLLLSTVSAAFVRTWATRRA